MAEAKQRIYAAIDLKSFYASVECSYRNLDPLTTNLVVADVSRTDKTICLAVSPSLKQYGIPGRARLFEVKQAVRKINRERLINNPLHQFSGKSIYDDELKKDPSLELDFIAATPRMKEYMRISSLIYETYLEFVSQEDIYVYSIDEVFIDLTGYLTVYQKSAHEIVRDMIRAVYRKTKITATAGIGTNLYLAKVAMDIMAKHEDADEEGVRIAYLDEKTYRKQLWDHRPLRDFWRVGKGYVARLEKHGLFTMGDIARQSLTNEEVLYKEFGVNAELLIDHAWGYEEVTLKDIKAYKPQMNSLSSGQVLSKPYDAKKGRLIVKEMAEVLALDLVSKNLYCSSIALMFGYDNADLESTSFQGEVDTDWYGRPTPKGEHGSANLPRMTNSRTLIRNAALAIYDRLMKPFLHLRRVYLVALNTVPKEKGEAINADSVTQLSLFEEPPADKGAEEKAALQEEEDLQKAILAIQERYGKNSVLKAMNLEEGGTTVERNKQIGGHKA